MAKAAYPTIGIAAFVMFGIVYFIGCLHFIWCFHCYVAIPDSFVVIIIAAIVSAILMGKGTPKL